MSCGCNAMKANGDPNGRSISGLKGLGRHAWPVTSVCVTVRTGPKDRVVCMKATDPRASKIIKAAGGIKRIAAARNRELRRLRAARGAKKGKKAKRSRR